MNQLTLPSLKGKFGNWVYFIATMKFSDVANEDRLYTVSEIAELYPKSINDVLQRELDKKRINKIAQYLKEQPERFLSSLIVAIFKGTPIWSEIRIEDDFKFNKGANVKNLDYARGRIGFLTLSGEEKMFVLDGQHRLKGIRDAFKHNGEDLGDDDVILTLVVHESNYKEKTRRLFTVLNRYAEKPKKAEWIIMEEDDAAAILTRRLLLTHAFFKKETAISKTRGFALPASDLKNFSTLVCLYDISKELIGYRELYPNATLVKRFSELRLNQLYKKEVLPFWDFFIESFPKVVQFADAKLKDDLFVRNPKNGGSLLLRPEGQLTISELYKHFQKKGKRDFETFKKRILKINFNLEDPLWKYLYWDGKKMNHKNRALKKKLFLFLLGEKINKQSLEKELNLFYKTYNDKFEIDLKPIR